MTNLAFFLKVRYGASMVGRMMAIVWLLLGWKFHMTELYVLWPHTNQRLIPLVLIFGYFGLNFLFLSDNAPSLE